MSNQRSQDQRAPRNVTPNAPGYGPTPPQQRGQYPSPQGQSFGHTQRPIVNQPRMIRGGTGADEWMNLPRGIPNCPPGLEYLTMIDQLVVVQEINILEMLTGFQTRNRYAVKNNLFQNVYYAVEVSRFLSRNCWGASRPFEMIILDNLYNEVIHLNRPLACDSCCSPCCLQVMEVFSPPDTIVGTVEQQCTIFCPTFAIKDASGDTVLRIEGPFCPVRCCCEDIKFKVMSADGAVQVGEICNRWPGFVREMFTDADYFGITFPMDLDARMKAVMLGACLLIDYMFYESSQQMTGGAYVD